MYVKTYVYISYDILKYVSYTYTYHLVLNLGALIGIINPLILGVLKSAD